MADVVMNMAGLMEIANRTNEKLAEPIAERIVKNAGDGYRVDKWPRDDPRGWARTRVFTDTPDAMRREARTGTLARALGQ